MGVVAGRMATIEIQNDAGEWIPIASFGGVSTFTDCEAFVVDVDDALACAVGGIVAEVVYSPKWRWPDEGQCRRRLRRRARKAARGAR